MTEPIRSPCACSVSTKKIHNRYFSVAVWVPVVLLVILAINAAAQIDFSGEQAVKTFILRYVLVTGPAAALLFALWATRAIRRKTREEVIRLAFWAPILFIPFYGIPWFVYGLCDLMTGNIHALALMVFWLFYAPYPVMFAYGYLAVVMVMYFIVEGLADLCARVCMQRKVNAK